MNPSDDTSAKHTGSVHTWSASNTGRSSACGSYNLQPTITGSLQGNGTFIFLFLQYQEYSIVPGERL